MKSCDYCGRGNLDDAIYCCECGTQFVAPEPEPQDEVESTAPLPDPECDVPDGEEAALCTACLFPNLPEATWCKRCGAPLSSNVMLLMPDAARAAGFVYRRALECRPKPIVVCGIWIHFFPGFISSVIALPVALEGIARGPAGFGELFFVVGAGIVCGSMLYRITRNYFVIPKITL